MWVFLKFQYPLSLVKTVRFETVLIHSLVDNFAKVTALIYRFILDALATRHAMSTANMHYTGTDSPKTQVATGAHYSVITIPRSQTFITVSGEICLTFLFALELLEYVKGQKLNVLLFLVNKSYEM